METSDSLTTANDLKEIELKQTLAFQSTKKATINTTVNNVTFNSNESQLNSTYTKPNFVLNKNNNKGAIAGHLFLLLLLALIVGGTG